jgi:hypothetical protein
MWSQKKPHARRTYFIGRLIPEDEEICDPAVRCKLPQQQSEGKQELNRVNNTNV